MSQSHPKHHRPQKLLRRLILSIALLTIILCALYIGQEILNRYKGFATYHNIAAQVWKEESQPSASMSPDTDTDPLRPPGLTDLMAANPNVIGWVSIPETSIDYPILQNKADNDFYLHRDLNGNHLYSGSIFLDSENDLDDPHIKNVYGHHMKAGYKNGLMFREVMNFKDPDFLKSHQKIYIWSALRSYTYKPLACVSRKADPNLRTLKNAEIEKYLSKNYDLSITPNHKILVLVTCSYGQEDERTYLICENVKED